MSYIVKYKDNELDFDTTLLENFFGKDLSK